MEYIVIYYVWAILTPIEQPFDYLVYIIKKQI